MDFYLFLYFNFSIKRGKDFLNFFQHTCQSNKCSYEAENKFLQVTVRAFLVSGLNLNIIVFVF